MSEHLPDPVEEHLPDPVGSRRGLSQGEDRSTTGGVTSSFSDVLLCALYGASLSRFTKAAVVTAVSYYIAVFTNRGHSPASQSGRHPAGPRGTNS